MSTETLATAVLPPPIEPLIEPPSEAPTEVMVPVNEPEPALTPEPVPQPPVQSTTDDELDQDFRIKIVDVSHGVVANAIDHADAYIAEQTTQHGFKGFIKRIWHGNIARDYIRQRESRHGREEITESGNIYALQDGTATEHDQEMAAVVTRFTNGFLHGDEAQAALSSVASGAQLERELKTLVNFFAQGAIDADILDEEKTRVLDRYKAELHEIDRNKGLLLADNVLEVAQAAKAAFKHGVGIDRIQQALTATKGDARMGARTEARRDLTDRIVDRVHSSRAGSLINEITLSVVAGIAVTSARFTTRKAVTAAAAVVGLGVGAGVVAGAREHARVSEERSQHSRERATGQVIEPDSKRREQMETTRYETISATSIIDQLAEARAAVASAEPAAIESAMRIITEVQTRSSISDEASVDLIDYSGTTNVEQERLGIDIALAEAKVATRQALGTIDETVRREAELDGDFDTILAERSEAVRDLILEDMSVKNAAFKKLQRNRTLKMAALGFTTGIVIGDAIQEARAAVSSELQGVFDGNSGSVHDRTLLAGIIGHHGATDSVRVNGSTTYNVDHTKHFTTSDVVHKEVHRTANEYLHHHPNEFTKVHRELWYDNNTPHVFDQNELRLDWGGANATGLDEHGNYVFNVQQMMANGSFHDGFSADAQHLIHEGKMAIALSMTQGTQAHVIMVPIDTHGNAVIHNGSWMAKSMFDNKGGQAHFTGAYAEAVQLMGKHHGVESTRMLATVVGEGHPKHITDIVSHVVHQPHEHVVTSTETIPNVVPVSGNIPIEIPFVLPLYSRRGLEGMSRPQPDFMYVGSPSYIPDGYRAGEGLLPRAGLAPFAPELQADPDAEIDAKKSTRRYVRAMRPSHRRTIDQLTHDLDTQPKAAQPKVVVMIPAAAHQEGGNIYNTLQQYALQRDVVPDDFEVVVFANYPEGSQPDATIDEVKRFQTEHPDVKVRLIQKELTADEAKIGWIRKAVTDAVIVDLIEHDVSLDDVMLVSNDADSEWISPTYLRTIIDKAEASPESDGFLGFIDWSYDAYKAHPEMLTATRFMQMVETYLRIAKHQVGSSGANFAFRPGMYAAVGGYKSNAGLGEDAILGRMIKSVRAGADGRRPVAFLGRSSEVNTSARRALEKLFKDGGAPALQWDEEFGVNDELRTRDFALEDFDYEDAEAVETMVRSCERMLNQTLKIYSGSLQTDDTQLTYRDGRLTSFDNETIRQLNRIGSFLGLQLAWQADGTMQITNAEKMIDGLKKWQARH